jgi:hypothetical protein
LPRVLRPSTGHEIPFSVRRFTFVQKIEVPASFEDDWCATTREPGSTNLVAVWAERV